MAATHHSQITKAETKAVIITALFQLLQEDKLANISISKVAVRAGVSRVAFYRYFADLPAVLEAHYEAIFEAIFAKIQTTDDPKVKLAYQTAFFQEFADEFLLADKQGFEFVIQGLFVRQMQGFYAKLKDNYLSHFMAAGVYAIWRQWLLDGQVRPLVDIHALLAKLDYFVSQ